MAKNQVSADVEFQGLVSQAPGAGANNQSPFLQNADMFSDYMAAFTAPATSSTLSSTLPAATVYVLGQRVVIPDTPFTVAASVTSYLDLSNAGVLTVSTSSTVTANSLRLWEVVSSATAITTVTGIALQGSPVIKFRAYANSTGSALTSLSFSPIVLDTITYNPQGQPILQSNGSLIPTKPGYYVLTFNVNLSNNSSTNTAVTIYKNGAEEARGSQSGNTYGGAGSALIYCNGTTDYLQLMVYIDTTTSTTNAGGSPAVSFVSLVGPMF
jgi:hypothetical protein